MVHAEMCDNWNYKQLAEVIKGRAKNEMKHAEMLIARILFLDGKPIVSNLNQIFIGAEVPKMQENDLGADLGAVKAYNDSIRLATELGDNNTKTLLESILKDEEDHVDWLEAQLDEIKQVGIQNYLAQQIYD
jgi:bacterioferritin